MLYVFVTSILFSSKMQYSGCESVGKNVMPIHFTVLP